jgi:hypothetical protein
MGIGLTTFNAQWAGLPAARSSVRIGRKQLDRCLCGSFATTRTATDEGTYDAVLASVKAVKTEWDAAFGAGMQKEGTAVQFCRAVETDWRDARIVGVSETDGILSLSLEAEYA